MAVDEYLTNMYDPRSKPRFLYSLIRNYLPEENHPFPSPSELSTVLSDIKDHSLLSESFAEPSDPKWRSAIDAWVERLLLLISSKMPDKCWAGIALLGATCQNCSTDRFLASYSAWFQKLLSHIQPPSGSQFVKVATCVSLSDMFTRLSGILNVKKDGTSLAGKLIEPVSKLLAEDGSEAVWEGAVDLLCTLVNLFPSSVYRHYDSVEAAVVSNIMSGKCTTNMSKKFAHCLALLPKARGDDSWSLMMQKILISINVHLNDAFQGLEEETTGSEAMRLLVPPGKEPPSPLGGQLAGEVLDHAAQMSDRLLISRVSTLMLSCSMMLTNPYPVQVTVPDLSLLALVRRVLLVDGSLSQALMPFTTVMQQTYICSKLPMLHMYSLDLLIAVIKGMRSQLLPNAADIVRLLTEYFRRCTLPDLRIKVYSSVKILILSMGVGMAPHFAQEVINNAFVDLDYFSTTGVSFYNSKYSKPATYAAQRPSNRKRKHVTTRGSTEDEQNGDVLVVEVPKSKPVIPISIQIAALQALEALLKVGGTLRSECWRADVDHLLISVARKACEGGWGNDERDTFIVSGELAYYWADFQLAALRALLASLLSPARVRPPYLSQGLELFRRGRQEAGTKLAEFCIDALFALELLIHPRALPLMDSSCSNCSSFAEGIDHSFPERVLSSGQKDGALFSRGVIGVSEPDPDDELYETWLRTGEDVEFPITGNTDNRTENSGEPFDDRDQQAKEDRSGVKLVVDGSVNPLADNGIREEQTITADTGRTADEVMVDTERSNIYSAVVDVTTSDKDTIIATDCLSNLDRVAMSSAGSDGPSVPDVDGNLIASTSISGKGRELVFGDDSDSLDSFPDVVFGDPDPEFLQ